MDHDEIVLQESQPWRELHLLILLPVCAAYHDAS